MKWIEKHAAYYRGYLPDDRSLVPVTIILATTVALWLILYLVIAVGAPLKLQAVLSAPQPTYVTRAAPR